MSRSNQREANGSVRPSADVPAPGGEGAAVQDAFRHFVPELLARLGAPNRPRPDGLLEVDIPAHLAQELAGPIAQPERVVLAFDETRAQGTPEAEWLTPASARFREWMELLRRRGRVARLTAVSTFSDDTGRGAKPPLKPLTPTPPLSAVRFEPWLSVGIALTPFSGDEAVPEELQQWVVSLVTGTAFSLDPSQLLEYADNEIAGVQRYQPSERARLRWRTGLPPKGSETVRRRLSMRKAYVIVRNEIARRSSSAEAAGNSNRAADPASGGSADGGTSRTPAPREVRARPYRAAVLYVPRARATF